MVWKPVSFKILELEKVKALVVWWVEHLLPASCSRREIPLGVVLWRDLIQRLFYWIAIVLRLSFQAHSSHSRCCAWQSSRSSKSPFAIEVYLDWSFLSNPVFTCFQLKGVDFGHAPKMATSTPPRQDSLFSPWRVPASWSCGSWSSSSFWVALASTYLV